MAGNPVASYMRAICSWLRLQGVVGGGRGLLIMCATEQCLSGFNVQMSHLGSCENTDSVSKCLGWSLRVAFSQSPRRCSATAPRATL